MPPSWETATLPPKPIGKATSGRSNSQGLPKDSQSSGMFLLHAIGDDLAEQAVLVADAVAEGVDLQRRHALHEAGGEPAEAAIAERRIRLLLPQRLQIHSLERQRLAHGVHQAEIAHRVEQQAADQEFER